MEETNEIAKSDALSTWHRDPEWRWWTSHGECFTIDDMPTGHIFNALIMIWDHVVPEEHMKIRPDRVYDFSASQRARWADDIPELYYELLRRYQHGAPFQVTISMMETLQKMEQYFDKARDAANEER